MNKQRLEKLGHQVYVFTFSSGEYQDDEPNVIRSPGVPILDTGFSFSMRYTREARRLLQTMDLVHVQHPFLSGTLALLYCHSRGIPIVFTNHTRYDLYTQAYLPMMPDVIGQAALQAYMPTFCRALDLVISPSEGMRDVLKGLGVDAPIEVIPNGVNLKPFQNPPDPIQRSELGFGPQHVILIFVGRIGPEKNLPFLLRSFTGAAQAVENLRLVLVGDGPERAALEEQAAQAGLGDKVKFTGPLPYEQVGRYMATADVFATASITEVHPLTVIEAMAAGLPILGISSPGVGDTVTDGKTGYLAPQEDQAMYTARMVRLAFLDEERRCFGENARRASQAYAIERTLGALLQCYQRVVAETAPRKRTWRARLARAMDRLNP
jgi:glycosyltransferase involved in cell wall biosynthesis